ncbi:MAG: hypothetical protein IJD30_01325 [Clostridia bacterium]|nr:hypothetical protein [Clostridia bacterium]
MKKFLTLLSAGILALSITACGGGDKPATSEPMPETTAQTSETVTTGGETNTEQSAPSEETAADATDTEQGNNTEQATE